MTQHVNREPSLKTVIWTTVKIVAVGVGGYFGIRALIDHNADVQAGLLNHAATLQAPGILQPRLGDNLLTGTPTIPPTFEPTATLSPTPIETPDLTWTEWPTTVDQFYQLVQVPEDQISPEYKADPNYRLLNPGMITQEFDKNGKPTGGFQIFFERDAGNNDEFPFVVIQNNSGVMQYGYMHDPNLRVLAGFTSEEVTALGIGDNHIGAGVPVTDGDPVAVEGLTFYPKINNVDGSGNVHFVWTALGPDMQTMSARLARSATSSILGPSLIDLNQLSPFELMGGNVTIRLNGSPVTFDGDDNPIYKVNPSHVLGGGLPSQITSFTDLPRQAQIHQRNPDKGIRRS